MSFDIDMETVQHCFSALEKALSCLDCVLVALNVNDDDDDDDIISV